MRRQKRFRRESNRFLYITGSFLIFFIILFIVLSIVYKRNLNDINKSMLNAEDIIGLSSDNKEIENTKLEEASSIISKTIEEVVEQDKNDEAIIEKSTEEENKKEINTTAIVEKPKVEIKKELSFAYPVEGEILKEFSMDRLVFSETLQEWTVHQGIDIKAARTTMVKASEEGTVLAIKNDPRYGLSIIIEHQDGYKTIYSNLLTTEFVSEGEKVEKGQSLGTVGNSAAFEIADEPHLHFEIIKNGEHVDPRGLIK